MVTVKARYSFFFPPESEIQTLVCTVIAVSLQKSVRCKSGTAVAGFADPPSPVTLSLIAFQCLIFVWTQCLLNYSFTVDFLLPCCRFR